MTIVPVDDVWIRVECEDHEAQELSSFFTFDIPGAQYMPAYRKKNWSGKIRLFKLRGHLLYRGLLSRLMTFAAQQGYQVTNEVPIAKPLYPDTLDDWVNAQPLPVVPREHQVAALRTLLNTHRGIVLSPTGSGKSLIIHLLTQALDVPTLIVVPTTGLVAQLTADFVSYGVDPDRIQTIQAGRPKDRQAPIVISTWQSIYQLSAEYFADYPCVMVDEVHLAKSSSLVGLMAKCLVTPYRFGFTGTLDDTHAHRLILEGLFGDVTQVTTTHDLVEQQQLSPLRVKMCVIKYPASACKDMRRALYPDEVEYLVTSPQRLDIIAKTAIATKGNVLVLFNFVEKHGIPLFERIQHLVVGRDVHFVHGGVPSDERERIRLWVEQNDNQIIVASFGTFSTGINIPNLSTLIFASPAKSKIRVLQSIGRTLRLSQGKTHATLLDFVDDLRVGRTVNHVFRHAEQRVQYYASERFPYTLHEYDVEMWLRLLSRNDAKTLQSAPSDAGDSKEW